MGLPLMVLEVYADESSKGDGNGVYLLCAYAAYADVWLDFANRWDVELKAEPSLPYYRTSDWSSRDWLNLHGVTMDQAIAKKEDLQNVLLRTPFSFRVTSTIEERHFCDEIKTQLRRPRHRKNIWLKVPYHFCFVDLHRILVHKVQNLNAAGMLSVHQLDLIVDEQGQTTDDAVFLFELLKKEAPEPFSRFIGSCIPADDKQSASLQAADMLASHLRIRYLREDDIFSGRLPVPRLCVTGLHAFEHHWKRAELAAFREGIKANGADHWLE